MNLETRVRITLILPLPESRTQHLVLALVIRKLTILCGGITTSPIPHRSGSDLSTIFQGGWVDPESPAQEIIREGAILIIADAAPSEELYDWLGTLKADAQHDFNQKLVWLTTHHIERISAHDPC